MKLLKMYLSSLTSILSLKRTIFAKLMVAFLVSMLPIYITGILIYTWGVNTLQAEIVNRDITQLQFYFESLQKEVDQIKTLESRYLTGREISWLVNTYNSTSAYDRGYYALRVQDNMVALKNSSNYLQDAAVYMPSICRKILASTGYDEMEPNDAQRMNALSTDTALSTDGANLYVNLAYPPYSSLTEKKAFYTIQACLSLQEMRKSLMQFDLYPGSGSVLFLQGFPVIASMGSDGAVTDEVIARIEKHRQSAPSVPAFSSEIDGKRYLITYAQSGSLGYTLGNYTLESEIYHQVRTNQYIVWALTCIAAIITAVFIYFVYRTIQAPMHELLGAFKRVDSGDMNFALRVNRRDEFQSVYTHFNDMLASINRLIKHTYEQKLLLKNAELDQLQAQINPHFIYNSYFLLHHMVKSDDKENAVYFSKLMGTYFQFITRSKGTSVQLCKEIEHARIYAQIQGMRFTNRITIHFEQLPVEYENVLVPRLIVQPILENAFQYALADKLADGVLRVLFASEPEYLVIAVEDNGDQLTDEKIQKLRENLEAGDVRVTESIGLLNIHRRLQAAFPDRGRLEINRADLGGMQVLLYIPLQGASEGKNV